MPADEKPITTTTATSIKMESSSTSTIPPLPAFDPGSTTWEAYRDRIDFYFEAYQITDDAHQKARFLCAIGDKTYHLLQSLAAPTVLSSRTMKFIDLVKLLDGHYDNTRNIMTASYDFYSCKQKEGQTFAEWKAELCEKLRHCGFTSSKLASKPQDRVLRDAYVMGVRSQKIRQALLKEEDPDLEKTERIIQLGERLEDDVRHFDSARSREHGTVAKIQQNQHKPPSNQHRQQKRSPKSDKNKPCETCGSNQHLRSQCKYREYTCNCCQRTGHLERVCRQKKLDKTTTKHVTTLFKVNVGETHTSKSCSTNVSLSVNDHSFMFELDTGSTTTIVSVSDWKILGSPTLRPSNYQLKCYSGQSLRIKGECDVMVNYQHQQLMLPMIVVHGNSVPILGLHWINNLNLDVNSIIRGPSSNLHQIHKIYNESKLKMILSKYQDILNKDLGHCTKVKAHIQLKSNAVPKFCKPRPIPFAYIEGVKEEIQRNVDAGILQKVDTSEWAAPIVPVKKPNGKIRICGDFKVTINPQIWVDQHPIPSVDELLTRLNNGQQFTKLDLSDAYLQIELDECSKQLMVINTPLGLFKYNRMPFGISNAPAIFQRIIDQVIAGIPHCAAYLDDILITGRTEEEHFQTLEAVLSKLEQFNLHCNPDKCAFFQDQVSYLGFIIDKHGKRPDLQRVESIANMPSPKNVREVEAFIGKINYYGQFISNFSDKCKPMNRLRRTNVLWNWSEECQNAFNDLKREICQATTLVHFDAKLPIILATDASNYGLGAVIMHRYQDGIERPIAYASKTLTDAEQRYSQIEKEALSIIYGVKKFRQYLIGQHFELVTDHQPLVSVFHPAKGIPSTTANRLQRWALCLMSYNYTIRYKPTHLHANADALSRLPAGDDFSFVDKESIQIHLIQTDQIQHWPVQPKEIEMATSDDEILKLVKEFTSTGWPSSIEKIKKLQLISYYNNRHSISNFSGCLMRGTQVIIPQQLRQRVLQMLHQNHLGVVKTKQLARAHCWWPKIEEDIVDMIRTCSTCSQLQNMPKREFKEWPEPTGVWSRIHIDFAGPIWGSKWLLMIDAKSKFPFVADMGNDTTATNVCNALEHAIDLFGPPEVLVSDNGPPFNSYTMKTFFNFHGIKHLNSPPYHPASNGLVERFVRSFKEGIKKEQQSGQTDKHLAVRNFLRSYRWSPHTTTDQTPASMMFQHPVRSALYRLKPDDKTLPDKRASKFQMGQLVLTKENPSQPHQQWKSAVIKENIGSMLYRVQIPGGKLLTRHQNQLRVDYSHDSGYFDDISPLEQPVQSTGTMNSTEQPMQNDPLLPTELPITSTHRYPQRERKQPQRFTPT